MGVEVTFVFVIELNQTGGLQLYVNAPLACIFKLPPLQTVVVVEEIETGTAAGSKTVSKVVSMQLLLSVTVTIYVPD